MIALIYKELRELRAIMVLMGALWLFGYLVLPFFERIDELGFYGLCYGACEPGIDSVSAWFGLLLTLATAYCLYPREHDSGTIVFLTTLPVSRQKIFVAKFIAGFGLLSVFEIAGQLISVAIIALNPDSIEGGQYWRLSIRYLLMVQVFLFVVLCHGLFISWFRTFGFVIYAIYVSVVNWLQTNYNELGFLNVFELLRFEYFGQELVLPLSAMKVQLPFAVFLLIASYFLWNRQPANTARHTALSARQPSKLQAWMWRMTKFTLPFVVFCGATMAVAYRISIEADVNGTQTTHLPPYTWFYRESDDAIVQALKAPGAQDYDDIRRLLGTEQSPEIVVDATRTSEHYAGSAGWKRIRMDLSGREGAELLRRVLSHETAHVFQSTLSEGQLGKFNNTVRFFTEGMAQYLSFQVVPGSDTQRLARALAALIVERQDIEIADLVDDQQFTRQFASEHVYSIGETWTAAMVNACGNAVLGDLLRYLQSEHVSARQSGLGWWRSTLQALDCDLGEVEGAWKQLLRASTADYQKFAGRGPSALDFLGLKREGENVAARFKVVHPCQNCSPNDSPEPSGSGHKERVRYLLRLRRNIDSDLASITVIRGRLENAKGVEDQLVDGGGVDGGELVTYSIPDEWHGERFQFQAGIGYPSAVPEYYEAWQSGTAPADE